MVEVEDKPYVALCVFTVTRSSRRRQLVALHIFVSQDWIQGHSEMLWAFGMCAYSDTVLVLSHLSCFVSWIWGEP